MTLNLAFIANRLITRGIYLAVIFTENSISCVVVYGHGSHNITPFYVPRIGPFTVIPKDEGGWRPSTDSAARITI